jgi:trehalose 6-phosphate synthase
MNAPTNDLVLVASNRGPLSFHLAEDGSLTSRRGGGGMVSALTSGLAATAADQQILWICAAMSDADRAAADHPHEEQGEIPVRMLDIPPDTFDQAYNGVANSVLWFVHHMLFYTPDQPVFGPRFRAQWDAYTTYNEAFAAALAQEYRDGARVLIQDYHLTLAPRLLRQARPDARIAHFSHSPWAPPEYYRMLPDDIAAAICEGILGADHAGFLSARWAEAFMDCCESVLGAQVRRADDTPRDGGVAGWVTHGGRVTEVAAHPLGIDVAGLRERAAREDVSEQVATLHGAGQGRQLIVRVDRTELSKNIIRGLEAYREMLKTYPQWLGKVVHVAFAYPSRSGLPQYQAYTAEVTKVAASVNAEFGTEDWEPVLLEVKDHYARSLAAYRVADVLLANPIRDGMNLVAEEGPALSERGCALVLSREAGAAGVLAEEALLVNPYDVTMTAQALHEALEMPPSERIRRADAIAAIASRLAPEHWVAAQLDALAQRPLR